MFQINARSAARKHGFSFEIDGDQISMSKRNSAGDDEPHPSVIAAAKALAKELATAYPLLKEHGAIEMLFIDEWVDLVIYPDKIFPKEKS